MVLNPALGLRRSSIENDNLMASSAQMPGHRVAHDSEANKSDPHYSVTSISFAMAGTNCGRFISQTMSNAGTLTSAMKRNALAKAWICARNSIRPFIADKPNGMLGFIIMDGAFWPKALLKGDA